MLPVDFRSPSVFKTRSRRFLFIKLFDVLGVIFERTGTGYGGIGHGFVKIVSKMGFSKSYIDLIKPVN